jgi:membrane protein YdbS with pleckstrin-like domain
MLGDDEDIVVEMRPHWVFFGGPLIIAAVAVAGISVGLVALGKYDYTWVTYIGLAVGAVPVLWFLGRMFRWRNYIIALTTSRIIVRRGVLDRNTLQLRLQRVTEVNTSQRLWERIVGVGRLILDVQGDDDSLVIEDVSKPLVFQRVINTQIDELVDRHRTDLYSGHPRPMGMASEDRRSDDGRSDDTPPHGVARVAAEPAPAAQAVAPGGTSGGSGGATHDQIRDRLIELDDLRQRGIISEEEFSAKKAELLDRI